MHAVIELSKWRWKRVEIFCRWRVERRGGDSKFFRWGVEKEVGGQIFSSIIEERGK